jgi:probable HAF family extracellular repeat protein
MAARNARRFEPTAPQRQYCLGPSRTSTSHPHQSYAFTLGAIAVIAVLVVSAVLVLLLRSPKLYKVTVLPSLGGARTWACSINDQEQVVGIAQTPGGQDHLFRWDRRHGMQDLGPARGNAYTCLGRCPAINNAGQIAAAAYDANGSDQAFLLDPNGLTTWVSPVGTGSRPCGINNQGQVAGLNYLTPDQPRGAPGFIWDAKSGTREIEGTKEIFAINDSGLMIAHVDLRKGPCLLQVDQQGQYISCDELPVEDSPFLAINNHGDVAGVLDAQADKGVFLWHRGEVLQRCPLRSRDACNVAMNDTRQVVFSDMRRPLRVFGHKLLEISPRSYLWDPQRGLIGLDGQLPRHLRGAFVVTDLNNTGCILGVVFSDNGARVQTVLLEPR